MALQKSAAPTAPKYTTPNRTQAHIDIDTPRMKDVMRRLFERVHTATRPLMTSVTSKNALASKNTERTPKDSRTLSVRFSTSSLSLVASCTRAALARSTFLWRSESNDQSEPSMLALELSLPEAPCNVTTEDAAWTVAVTNTTSSAVMLAAKNKSSAVWWMASLSLCWPAPASTAPRTTPNESTKALPSARASEAPRPSPSSREGVGQKPCKCSPSVHPTRPLTQQNPTPNKKHKAPSMYPGEPANARDAT
mmetsp:Transcript_48178/g.92100  ORF Transcript_48178/g.92100 Transcript_48178/m.92100 type:complete len:251 (-) Transcript_48178:292-1044(-)